MSKRSDAYRTISEVAKWLGTQSHVIRYWESKFEAIQPMKSSGGRRYFKPDDMRILGGIKHFLHVEGITIKNLQKKIDDEGLDFIVAASPSIDDREESDVPEEKSNNVIAFTIDALPGPKKKQVANAIDEGEQQLLFPELETPLSDPKQLTPIISARPAPEEIPEAPMLNLFDDDPDIAPTPPPAPVLMLPKAKPLSSFPKELGFLGQLVKLSKEQRLNFVTRNEVALHQMFNEQN